MQPAESARHIEPQNTLRPGVEGAGGGVGFLQLIQNAPCTEQERAADLREMQPPGRTVEQRGTELGLQFRDRPRDGAGLDPRLQSRPGKPAQLGSADEIAKLGQPIHSYPVAQN